MKSLVLKETVVPYWCGIKIQDFGKNTFPLCTTRSSETLKFGIKLVDKVEIRGFAKV